MWIRIKLRDKDFIEKVCKNIKNKFNLTLSN